MQCPLQLSSTILSQLGVSQYYLGLYTTYSWTCVTLSSLRPHLVRNTPPCFPVLLLPHKGSPEQRWQTNLSNLVDSLCKQGINHIDRGIYGA